MKKRVLQKIVSVFSATVVSLSAVSAVRAAAPTFKIGDYISIGTFDDSQILWRVVDIEDNYPVLITDRTLNDVYKRFDDNGSNYWPGSTMCSWLNGDFYSSAFSEDEKSLVASKPHKNIITSGHIDSVDSYSGSQNYIFNSIYINVDYNEQKYNEAYSVIGTEKVFLPDVKQIYDMQVTNKDSLGENYAVAKSANGDAVYCWTRTSLIPSNLSNFTENAYVTQSTAGNFGSAPVNYASAQGYSFSIRPMIYIDPDMAIVNKGTGSETDPYTLAKKEANITATAENVGSYTGDGEYSNTNATAFYVTATNSGNITGSFNCAEITVTPSQGESRDFSGNKIGSTTCSLDVGGSAYFGIIVNGLEDTDARASVTLSLEEVSE